jgi:hypothetical protein
MKVINFVWGWSLMIECYLWSILQDYLPKGKIKDKCGERACHLGIFAINRLTNGRAFSI